MRRVVLLRCECIHLAKQFELAMVVLWDGDEIHRVLSGTRRAFKGRMECFKAFLESPKRETRHVFGRRA